MPSQARGKSEMGAKRTVTSSQELNIKIYTRKGIHKSKLLVIYLFGYIIFINLLTLGRQGTVLRLEELRLGRQGTVLRLEELRL